MASKYRTGQRFVSADGKAIEIASVEGSCHGNTSRVLLKRFGFANIPDGQTDFRPTRTKSVSELIKRFGMSQA